MNGRLARAFEVHAYDNLLSKNCFKVLRLLKLKYENVGDDLNE